MKRLLITGAGVLLLLAVAVTAQVKQTENTLKLEAGKQSAAAKIDDMRWLVGTWRGPGLGGVAEEIWSEPAGGVMMGSFRMLKGDEPVFYEFMTLSETGGSLVLRVKHFSPELVAWEEKDKTVDFQFIKRDGKRYYFDGLTFEVDSPDAVKIYLAMQQKDGSSREETFEYKKVKSGGEQ